MLERGLNLTRNFVIVDKDPDKLSFLLFDRKITMRKVKVRQCNKKERKLFHLWHFLCYFILTAVKSDEG